MGLKIGDTIIGGGDNITFSEVQEVQKYINENKGSEITLIIQRGNDKQLALTGTPRVETE